MARARFDISVNERDIEKAQVGDSYRCVVMQAIARQVPNAHRIDVDLQTIRWTDEEGRHVFLTPYEVAGYIVGFDAGDPIHPFSFQLRNSVPALQRKAVTRGAKKYEQAESKVGYAKRRVRKAKTVMASPDARPEDVARAKAIIAGGPDEIRKLEEERESIKAAYQAAGERTTRERVSAATRKSPPRVFKTKRRLYGHRVLRVNQAEDRKHYAG